MAGCDSNDVFDEIVVPELGGVDNKDPSGEVNAPTDEYRADVCDDFTASVSRLIDCDFVVASSGPVVLALKGVL